MSDINVFKSLEDEASEHRKKITKANKKPELEMVIVVMRSVRWKITES